MKTGDRWTHILGWLLVAMLSCRPAGAEETPPAVEELRRTYRLEGNWQFIQDDTLSDDAALSATGTNWQTVRLPHTWNAEDAASTKATKPYKRGIGWYRLEFDAPPSGARIWLEFGAASMVADVWLNGQKLGQHKGGFTAFRFDITNIIASGKNVLLVKINNSTPVTDHDITAILPLTGDFNISGGLYRYVSMLTTADPIHIELGDFGGPGVYATTKSIADGNASVNVRSKLKNDTKHDGEYIVRASLLDADGKVAQTAQQPVRLRASRQLELTQELQVEKAHLWQGVEDPYQYKLVVEVLRSDGKPIDQVVQDFGIRQMRFDANEGFFLNGRHVRLRGVAIHQDSQGKGWAMSDRDVDESFDLIKEIGANSVRLGHYPFSQYVLERANKLGLVVWSEVPYGVASTTELLPLATGMTATQCPTRQPTEQLRANAMQQLQEMIRQQFNHASVGMWSVGNEITFMNKNCPGVPYDNVTPLLRELHALAKAEDPSRVTTMADFTEEIEDSDSFIHTGGITDIWATNRYYLWYSSPFSELGPMLDAFHARYPGQPLGVSEYGAGAALTHHTDDPVGGPVESGNTGQQVAYQPEEYASYVHEQNYALFLSKKYLWGTYVWNMFDFATGIRNEGDMRGVNTKGLVTFDRKTRKDPFYFYKANWSKDPVTHLTGKHYKDRAYSFNDVKVYSNAQKVDLSVNGKPVGSLSKDQAQLNTYLFKDVKFSPGANQVVALGHYGDQTVTDTAEWTLSNSGVNIAAGQLTTGLVSCSGTRFGSDHFFNGGEGDWMIERNTKGVTNKTPVRGTQDVQLFSNFRRGDFSYSIPTEDGTYFVTLGFLEPNSHTALGDRVFNVVVNGQTKIENFDVLAAAGEYRTAVTRTFLAQASDGQLRLEFKPIRGEAVVSNIMIKKQ